MIEKLLYTKQEAAYALARSLRTITYMISNKEIQTRRDGRRVLIPASEVRRVAGQNYYQSHRKSA